MTKIFLLVICLITSPFGNEFIVTTHPIFSLLALKTDKRYVKIDAEYFDSNIGSIVFVFSNSHESVNQDSSEYMGIHKYAPYHNSTDQNMFGLGYKYRVTGQNNYFMPILSVGVYQFNSTTPTPSQYENFHWDALFYTGYESRIWKFIASCDIGFGIQRPFLKGFWDLPTPYAVSDLPLTADANIRIGYIF